MKAIRLHEYGTPDKLILEEISMPQIKDNEVLVKIHAASVNHIDWGKASGAMKQFFPVQFPWTPGEDFSGTVEQVGENVSGFKQGDAVYGDLSNGGAYAEYVAANPKTLSLKPTKLSFTEAASVPVVAQTAWQGLFTHAHLREGQTVLIHGGAGAVGGYAVQFAHQAGAKVIVTASGLDEEFLRSLGADQVIDYKKEKFESLIDPVDAVFDLVGGETQQRSYAVIKKGGYLVAVNQPPSPEQAAKHGISAVMMNMEPSTSGLKHLAELIDSGKIKTDLADVYPLEKAAASWSGMANPSGQKNRHGKIVLEVI